MIKTMIMRKIMKIPKYAQDVTKALNEAGFEAFLVGGCVRDLLMKREPKDWDIATNAKPEEIVKTFPDGKYENGFGTVMLPIKYLLEDTSEKTADLGVIEITTYRIESKYTDRRHPDEVKFAKTLEEDLGRRDFTINALALEISQNKKVDDEHRLIDLFEGQKDLENKVIRAVGEPSERFAEDALRMMRAVRFSVQLDFSIEEKTFLAIQKNANNLKYISKERIQDELQKIILSQKPARGMELLHKTGLLNHIIPEIEEGFNVTQSHHHYHGPYKTVFKHLVASLEKCPSQKLEVRLASLLHDIGKPLTKKGEGEDATFHNHEYAGAKIAKRILERLKFPRAVIDKTVLLVRNHMFYYNVDEVGEAGVRRVIRKVGLENINDLIDVRIADRLGSGVPKAVPYKLRHFKFMVEKVSQDPISVKQLKINGNDLMEKLKISPGPKIGTILDVLLAKVIEEPKLNEKETLLEIAKDLDKKNLNDLRKMAKAKIEEEKEEEERLMKKKYWVE
jgi:tRNA nucleotidyltransferase (CCA-adding enzyme)